MLIEGEVRKQNTSSLFLEIIFLRYYCYCFKFTLILLLDWAWEFATEWRRWAIALFFTLCRCCSRFLWLFTIWALSWFCQLLLVNFHKGTFWREILLLFCLHLLIIIKIIVDDRSWFSIICWIIKAASYLLLDCSPIKSRMLIVIVLGNTELIFLSLVIQKWSLLVSLEWVNHLGCRFRCTILHIVKLIKGHENIGFISWWKLTQ